jgi:uncharacterized protein (DUF2132 family)
MHGSTSKDPLHGVTLEQIVTELAAHYGWPELGRRIPIRCFLHDASIKSSLIPFTIRNETLAWTASVCLLQEPALADQVRHAGAGLP